MEAITLAALTVAVTQLIKQVGINRRYLPVIAVVVGILGSFALAQTYSIPLVLEGLVAGLSAMGLWTGARVVTDNE